MVDRRVLEVQGRGIRETAADLRQLEQAALSAEKAMQRLAGGGGPGATGGAATPAAGGAGAAPTRTTGGGPSEAGVIGTTGRGQAARIEAVARRAAEQHVQQLIAAVDRAFEQALSAQTRRATPISGGSGLTPGGRPQPQAAAAPSAAPAIPANATPAELRQLLGLPPGAPIGPEDIARLQSGRVGAAAAPAAGGAGVAVQRSETRGALADLIEQESAAIPPGTATTRARVIRGNLRGVRQRRLVEEPSPEALEEVVDAAVQQRLDQEAATFQRQQATTPVGRAQRLPAAHPVAERIAADREQEREQERLEQERRRTPAGATRTIPSGALDPGRIARAGNILDQAQEAGRALEAFERRIVSVGKAAAERQQRPEEFNRFEAALQRNRPGQPFNPFAEPPGSQFRPQRQQSPLEAFNRAAFGPAIASFAFQFGAAPLVNLNQTALQAAQEFAPRPAGAGQAALERQAVLTRLGQQAQPTQAQFERLGTSALQTAERFGLGAPLAAAANLAQGAGQALNLTSTALGFAALVTAMRAHTAATAADTQAIAQHAITARGASVAGGGAGVGAGVGTAAAGRSLIGAVAGPTAIAGALAVGGAVVNAGGEGLLGAVTGNERAGDIFRELNRAGLAGPVGKAGAAIQDLVAPRNDNPVQDALDAFTRNVGSAIQETLTRGLAPPTARPGNLPPGATFTPPPQPVPVVQPPTTQDLASAEIARIDANPNIAPIIAARQRDAALQQAEPEKFAAAQIDAQRAQENVSIARSQLQLQLDEQQAQVAQTQFNFQQRREREALVTQGAQGFEQNALQERRAFERASVQLDRSFQDIDTALARNIEDVGTRLTDSFADIGRNLSRQQREIAIGASQAREDVGRNLARQEREIGIGAGQAREDIGRGVARQTRDLEIGVAQSREDLQRNFARANQDVVLNELLPSGLTGGLLRNRIAFQRGLEDLDIQERRGREAIGRGAGDALTDVGIQEGRAVAAARRGAGDAQQDIGIQEGRAQAAAVRGAGDAMADAQEAASRAIRDAGTAAARAREDAETTYTRAITDANTARKQADEDLFKALGERAAQLRTEQAAASAFFTEQQNIQAQLRTLLQSELTERKKLNDNITASATDYKTSADKLLKNIDDTAKALENVPERINKALEAALS